jgi:predicted PurR-regulated permease PerM
MQHKQTQFFSVLIGLLLVGSLLHLLGPILTPFVVGGLLAYLANPLVNILMRLHFSRLLSSVIIFVLLLIFIVLLILLLIPLMQKQIVIFVDVVPNMIEWVQNTIVPWLQQTMGVNEELVNIATLKKILGENLTSASGAVDWLLHKVLLSGEKIIEFFMNLILIPVVTFYLLCDWNKILFGLRSLIPRNSEPTVTELVKECDSVLGAFFRGQFLVMLALAAIYSIGLTVIGLQIGVLIGVLAGLLTIVPYLGSIIGVVTASIAAFVQFGTLSSVLLVWLVFIVGHLIEHVFLTPKLVGDRIGLHPVAVIFAILTGGTLFGFFGVLLALPVAAVIMVWVRYLHRRYRHSKLYQQS